MKKLLLVLLLFPLLYTCQLEEVESYKEDNTIEKDTINIERIKIETH
jgi:hypothetical protein